METDLQLVRASIETIGDGNTELSSLFYTRLFQLEPSLTDIFDGGVPMLNRKFINMLLTFKTAKNLDALVPALQAMAKRHFGYGAEVAHFAPFREALIYALEQKLGDGFGDELRAAWLSIYDSVCKVMIDYMESHAEERPAALESSGHHIDPNLLEDIGGEEKVRKVHQRLYDGIYEDDYIGQFFFHRAKDLLIRKQTAFMVAAFGGPNHYAGEPPAFLHMHMFITREMAEIRNVYLRNAILAEGLGQDICDRWLSVDNSFLPAIVKQSADECVMRCWGQAPFTIKKPAVYVPPKPQGGGSGDR